MPGPVPYVSEKSIPWNYGRDIYYHGIKQIEITEESSDDEEASISNIAGTSKITRSGRIFSPEIAPPRAIFGPSSADKVIPAPIKLSARTPLIEDVVVPNTVPPTTTNKGKGIQDELVKKRAQPLVIPETSKKEMDEISRIIKRSETGELPSRSLILLLIVVLRSTNRF